ncbi:hypothetical protein [Algivirga pacifica]|uniref:Outer membrane protein beta-barrel domain-containing protein n=1 Tax=Algivirga pacifica TaxID=1162670 RepID=A0ABP9D4Z5_9BACT
MKKIIYSWILCLYPLFSYAQDSIPPDAYPVKHSLGLHLHSLVNQTLDHSISSLTYLGGGIGGGVSYEATHPKRFQQVKLHTGLNAMGPITGNELSDALQGAFHFIIGYDYLRSIIRQPSYRLLLGPSFISQSNIRYNTLLSNSAVTYDSFSGLTLSGRLEASLPIRHRTLRPYLQTQLGILGLGIRPFYATTLKVDTLYTYLATIGNHPFFLNELGINYPLQNGNALALSYTWNYYSVHEFNTVWNATHFLRFSLFFDL